jgi:hypothetical protein
MKPYHLMVRVNHVHTSVDKKVDLLGMSPPGSDAAQGHPVVTDTALCLVIASKRSFGYSI